MACYWDDCSPEQATILLFKAKLNTFCLTTTCAMPCESSKPQNDRNKETVQPVMQ